MDTITDAIGISPARLVLGSFATYVLGTWAYNLWFHPLRHIPGPWYCAISPLYLTFKDMQFVKAHFIHELHKTYGPVVRIEPNQVAFLDQETVRVAYGGSSKFEKSVFYKALKCNATDHAMTTLEIAPHAVRKRAYAPHYVPANLALYQPELHEFVNVFLDRLYQRDGKTTFDCLILFRRLFVDSIFMTSYGQRINALKEWDDINETKDPAFNIVRAINQFPIRGVAKASVPAPVWAVISRIPIPAWQILVDSDNRVSGYVIQARDNVIANDPQFKLTGEIDAHQEDERLSLIHRLLRQSLKAKPEDKLKDDEMIAEATAHTIAGVDTSSTVISYMLYNLTSRPDILAELRAEIDPLMPNDGEGGNRRVPDISVLNKLPYLTAFVKESLRVHGSAPSLLERIVPSTLNGPFAINGYEIPAGTNIATQSYSVHRIPEVFPEPDAFKPERWFNETDEMRANMMPFGTGQRICGGMNLAHIMLRITLAAVIRNFDIVVPPETTPESMEHRFAFVLLPAAQKVPLIFKPRADTLMVHH
ncbi:hypothetical protein FRB96_003825 [Tulasnella sp. 330]|nr:hypothetical protein FRB96_003825 [Tulasnella sp. 330]KAG8883156.1 hypothetical protein FRB97_007091 [Tulasnella sp. 331]KAG8888460.1 hypothetical protein FRB98_007589 [Tulasnella sp. 332]